MDDIENRNWERKWSRETTEDDETTMFRLYRALFWTPTSKLMARLEDNAMSTCNEIFGSDPGSVACRAFVFAAINLRNKPFFPFLR